MNTRPGIDAVVSRNRSRACGAVIVKTLSRLDDVGGGVVRAHVARH